MPERVGSRARRFRFAPAGAGPRGVARLADREFAGNSRETRRAARARVRRATRTWTLDALRAATEPVKVEAMQAMMLGGCCWWWVGCVCGNDFHGVVQRYLCQMKLLKICARKNSPKRFFIRSADCARLEN